MGCVACGAQLPDAARFCSSCGAPQPQEDPAKVAEYAAALRTLGHRTEAWATAELATLRAELEISEATHARLASELAPLPQDRIVGLWLDEQTVRDFRAGEQCLLRLRLVNEGQRAIRSATLTYSTSATEGTATAQLSGVLGPGEGEILALMLRPGVSGHHQLTGALEVETLRGASSRWGLESVHFRVAGHGALQQSIQIDARAQKVGIFENIGAAPSGGVVGAARWRAVGLTTLQGPSEPQPEQAPAALPIGHRGPGVVVATAPDLRVELEGAEGLLVDLEDPSLRPILSPGDRLTVTVIGTDGQGTLLLSTRPGSPRQAPASAPEPTRLDAGPGQLAEIVAAAAPGATITITGPQQGPVVLDRPLTLDADGAVLEVARGAGLKISADVVVRGLTIRGTAPAGSYAPDGVEITSGRVVLEGCDVSVNGTNPLTPGRGVAITGPALVEIHRGQIHDCGVGVALDVGWGGFAVGRARGARVGVHGVALQRNGLAAVAAGAERELHLARCTLSDNLDGSVRAIEGAVVTVEDCTLPAGSASADAGSTLNQRGNR